MEEITRRDNGGRNKNDKRARVLLFIVTDCARWSHTDPLDVFILFRVYRSRNGEIIPFFSLFPLQFSNVSGFLTWRPIKAISNACATHVFIGNTSRLSLSFSCRVVEARTTLWSRAIHIASPYDFEEKSRREIRKRAFKDVRQIDNSEWFSKDSGNQRAYSLRRQTMFTLQVCFHWPDKRYLPIIIARLDMCFFARSFLPATP